MKTFTKLFLISIIFLMAGAGGIRSEASSTAAESVDATADPASGILTIHAIDIPNASGSVDVFEASLQLTDVFSLVFELISASPSSREPGNNATADLATGAVNIPQVAVESEIYAVTLALVPTTNPLRFRITQVTSVNAFAGTYAGTFEGDDFGTWTVTVDSMGNITGTGLSADVGEFDISGRVNSDGSFTFAAGSVSTGATFSGTISPTGELSGTWADNDTLGGRGTFTGQKV